jgi:hypothetical protein
MALVNRPQIVVWGDTAIWRHDFQGTGRRDMCTIIECYLLIAEENTHVQVLEKKSNLKERNL